MFPIVLDTGALVLLQQTKGRRFYEQLRRRDSAPIVPAPVLTEWYAGAEPGEHGPGERKVLDLIKVRPVDRVDAMEAGRARQALALAPAACKECGCVVPRSARVPSAVDAIVIAVAASLGKEVVVYTSDVDDLSKVRSASPDLAHVAVLPLP